MLFREKSKTFWQHIRIVFIVQLKDINNSTLIEQFMPFYTVNEDDFIVKYLEKVFYHRVVIIPPVKKDF